MFFNHCTTLDELKAEYRKLALASHPDHGGNTETMQRINAEYDAAHERLKAIYNAANPDKQTTETPEEFREVIDALMKLHGLDVELCGRWLWIGGNTKENKEALKACGCRWSQNKKLWYWRHEEDGHRYRRGSSTMASIRNKYGSQRVSASGEYSEHDQIGA